MGYSVGTWAVAFPQMAVGQGRSQVGRSHFLRKMEVALILWIRITRDQCNYGVLDLDYCTSAIFIWMRGTETSLKVLKEKKFVIFWRVLSYSWNQDRIHIRKKTILDPHDTNLDNAALIKTDAGNLYYRCIITMTQAK